MSNGVLALTIRNRKNSTGAFLKHQPPFCQQHPLFLDTGEEGDGGAGVGE